ncbi:MAG: DUF3710 domain-containing protein [Propionibacteriaceae bacterium]|nr:DUF3710 domain-containing protein [Propionibacteriaceae bacterium]
MFGSRLRKPASEYDAIFEELNALKDEEDRADASSEADIWRTDGPFDISEVEIERENVIDLGALIVTHFPGLQLQLLRSPDGEIHTVLAVWKDSALGLSLFAEATSTDSTDAVKSRLEAFSDQIRAADGEVVWNASGPFGLVLQVKVPVEADAAADLGMQVSQVWAVKGPRWVLQGQLLGEQALHPLNAKPTKVFLEFFRNAVVRRGVEPIPPGGRISLSAPEEE